MAKVLKEVYTLDRAPLLEETTDALGQKKKHLYRGKKNLDYENAFSDNKKSQKKIKEHMRKVKESLSKENI